MTTLFLSIILSLVAGILLSGFLYFRNKGVFSAPLTALLFALRALGLGLICFLILAPFLNFKTKEIYKPVVAVLVDNSSSMVAGADSTEIKNQLFTEAKNQLGTLENAEVQFFSFDEELHNDRPDFRGNATDISNALQSVSKQVATDRLAALVLVSDGIVNRGTNPLYQIENSFLPIFTVATGDSARQVDVSISSARAPEYVFRGDEIFIEATVSAENARGFKGNLSLNQNGKSLENIPVAVQENNFAKIYTFSVPATVPGITVFTLNVSSAEGELNTNNNSRQVFVEVIENRKKIAVLATAPHPDVAALTESLKKVDAYEVSFNNYAANNALTKETELAVLFLQRATSESEVNSALQNYNGPLWLVIDPLMNGQILSGKLSWLSKVGQAQSSTVTPQINTGFGLFNLSKETENGLKKLGELTTFSGDIRAQGSFENLLANAQNNLMASYGKAENKHVAVFNFSGLWQWRMKDYQLNGSHKVVDEWLQLTAQYLTSSNNKERLKLTYEKRLAVGDEVEIMADVYNAAFELAPQAEVSMSLKNENGEAFSYQFSPLGNRFKASINGLEPGNYTFDATAKLGNETLHNKGAFFIESQRLESLKTRADYLLMAQLAEATHGKFFSANPWPALQTELSELPYLKPIEKVKTKSLSLIDLQWFFYIALFLLALEWALRRYFGSI